MPKRGKKYQEAVKGRNKKKQNVTEAVKVALDSSFAKFDETIDVAVRLGVDPRHAEQMVRGSVILPNGIGKEVKVLVFAKGEKETEADSCCRAHCRGTETGCSGRLEKVWRII